MKRLIVGVLALASLVVVACFSERGSGPIVSGAAECRVPVTVIDSMHYIIALRNFAFHPDSIAVPVGATVTWVNCEDAGVEAHTTTSDTTGIWDSPLLIPGARFSRSFPIGGVFPYHCTPHRDLGMVGKLVVQ
jgi:plastocyanin